MDGTLFANQVRYHYKVGLFSDKKHGFVSQVLGWAVDQAAAHPRRALPSSQRRGLNDSVDQPHHISGPIPDVASGRPGPSSFPGHFVSSSSNRGAVACPRTRYNFEPAGLAAGGLKRTAAPRVDDPLGRLRGGLAAGLRTTDKPPLRNEYSLSGEDQNLTVDEAVEYMIESR